VRFKKFSKNLGLIFLVNLLTGCAQNGGKVVAEEPSTPESIPPMKIVSLPTSRPVLKFYSRQQEYMYKLLVAEVAWHRGKYEVAAEYFLEITKKTGSSQLAERATKMALLAKNLDQAIEAANLWVEIDPTNYKGHQLLSQLLFRQKRLDEGLVHLDLTLEALKDEQQRQDALDNVIRQQTNVQAVEIMERLRKQKPNNAVILFGYARLLSYLEHWPQAREILQQLLKLVPNHAEAIPLYADILMKQEQPAEALEWLQQALYKYPNQHEWRFMYAKMLAEQEFDVDAIEQFKQLLVNYPQHTSILHYLGILSLKTEKLSSAKKYFIEMLKIGEQADVARYFLGQIAYLEKDFDEALTWYRQVEADEIYSKAQTQIAIVLLEKGEFDKAIEHLRRIPDIAVIDDEEAIKLINFEAELLIDKQRYSEAMAAYDRGLNINPKDTEILRQRAILAEKLGHFAEAEQNLRMVLNSEPTDANTLNTLGYILTEHTTRYQEAYELIKQALTLQPNKYHILDSMGWVLYKMGNYDEAIAYIRKALSIQNDAEVATHLGEVLWVSGDHRSAKEIWEQASEDFPNDENLRKVMRRFLP
jgi:tetratricopeptide (TPR) repeat protein